LVSPALGGGDLVVGFDGAGAVDLGLFLLVRLVANAVGIDRCIPAVSDLIVANGPLEDEIIPIARCVFVVGIEWQFNAGFEFNSGSRNIRERSKSEFLRSTPAGKVEVDSLV
jgi:hypothetical protein